MSQRISLDHKVLFESLPGLYLILSPRFHILGVSRAYLEATLTEREQITGRYLFDVFPDNPADPGATGVKNLTASLTHVLEHKAPHKMAVQQYDIRRPDGRFEQRYWSPVNTPVTDESGQVLYIIHQVEDVTALVLSEQNNLKQEEDLRVLNQALLKEIDERKLLEEEMKRFNKSLESQIIQKNLDLLHILDRITDGFITLDKDFNYVYANKQIGQMIKLDPSSLIGRNVREVFPDAVGSATYHAFQKAMEEQQYIRNTDYYPQLNLWQENHIYPSPEGLSVFIRDISEQKEAENKLKQSNTELRALAARLQTIREEEQRRIALEIHDQLGQQATGLKMDISWLKKKMTHLSDPVSLQYKLSEIGDQLDETIGTIRRISAELHPSILENLGIIAALSWQSEEFEKRFSVRVRFRNLSEDLELQLQTAVGLYRIYQECLTNIARHSGASSVYTTLSAPDNDIILEIEDNGNGFDPGKKTIPSLGLTGMKERALMMNGTFHIHSVPGKGTKVIVKVPQHATSPESPV